MKERFLLEREKMFREGIEDRLFFRLNRVEDILNDVGREKGEVVLSRANRRFEVSEEEKGGKDFE